jgi:TPR repeat protein
VTAFTPTIRIVSAFGFAVFATGPAYATAAADDLFGYSTRFAGAPLGDVQKAAQAGDGVAQLELGHRYYSDQALKDDKTALYWFQKAADQHVGWAEYEAATMYENGEGTAAAPEKAFTLYQAAAHDGVVRADADLGIMYLSGDGTAKDVGQAFTWFKAGTDAGEPRAECGLAILYRDGLGVTRDYTAARKLFRASAAQRFAPAAYALGDMIKQGQGGDKDLVVGQAWRIMGKYLEAPKPDKIPEDAQVVGAVLVSPDLTEQQNHDAEAYYFKLMKELGFSKPAG